MKITNNAPELTTGNIGNIGQFTIKASVHSFRILSSGLYSNKIKAIVRELSCNAVDSHVAAGTADTPFVVHLPNALEPYFSVRDFGTGLSGEDVMTVYTRYFESTKQDSNDYIGALGLGSKSPFSYTDNFTVTAIVNGVQRIYSAFIDGTGCPAIAEMGSCDTNEPNGVEVKFSVTDRNDIYRFAAEASEVFKWFKNKPQVVGNSDYRVMSPELKTENISPGVHLASNIRGPVAVQGNIAYPIRLPTSENYQHLEALMRSPLIIEFNIGDVEIAASREELSYTDDTIKTIVNRYETIRDDIAKFINREVSPIMCEWERALKLLSFDREEVFRNATRKLVEDGCSKLVVYESRYGSLTTSSVLEVDANHLAKQGVNIRVFKVDTWRKTAVREVKPKEWADRGSDGAITNVHRCYALPLTKNMEFVTNDNDKKILNRVREHYSTNGKHDQLVVLLTTDKDSEDSDSLYKEFFDSIYNPPLLVHKAADFATPERAITNKYDILTVKSNGWHSRSGNPFSMAQTDFAEDLSEQYWYVPLSNFMVLDENGKHDTEFLNGVMKNLLASGILDINTALKGTGARKIYGVRKGAIEEVKKRKNWKNAYTEVRKILKKYDVAELHVPIYKDIVSQDIVNTTIIKNIGMLDNDSDFRIFCEETAAVLGDFSSKKNEKAEAHKWLMEHFNIRHTAIDISKDVKARYDALFEKYPMLKFMNYNDYGTRVSTTENATRLLDYIKLIDNTRGNTK